MQAEAERERARAELTLAQLETRAAIGRAQRQRNLALERIRRDQALVGVVQHALFERLRLRLGLRRAGALRQPEIDEDFGPRGFRKGLL